MKPGNKASAIKQTLYHKLKKKIICFKKKLGLATCFNLTEVLRQYKQMGLASLFL